MSKSLLVADDSLTIRKAIGMIFATEDFEITAVDNGLEAISRARELKPDLLVADVTMPGKSGYEVCEAIKSDPETQHIPVLLLAGTFEPFDEGRARGVRADDYLVKPFESQALLDKVRTLTGVPKPTETPRQVFVPDSGSKPTYPTGAVPRSAPAPSAIHASQPAAVSTISRSSAPGYPAAPGGPRPMPGAPPPPSVGRPAGSPMPYAGIPRSPPPTAPSGYPAPPGSQYRGQAGPMPRGPVPPTPPPGMGPGTAPHSYRSGMPASATLPRTPVPTRPASPAAAGPFPGQPPNQRMPTAGYAPAPQPRAPFGPTAPAMRPGNAYDPRQAPYPPQASYPAEPARGRHPQPPSSASGDGGEAALREALSNASREVIERIAWEVIPQLAEVIIREHVNRLVKEREGSN